MTDKQQTQRNKNQAQGEPVISLVTEGGMLAELLYDSAEGKTGFAVWRNGKCEFKNTVTVAGQAYCPYSPGNNILKHKVVLLPSDVQDYGSDDSLIREIEAFLDRYVDLSPEFKRLTCRYILLTWLHDRFNELPYLRLRGDYGTGKTRFLLVVGALCYKPIFANGASTISPLFHLLDAFKGTLILDEADFRFSDEKADMIKILNAGNVRGIPILRTMMTNKKEFDPRAFSVFGPKIIAGRGRYEDPALESRCITEETAPKKLRPDIPLNLPGDYEREALTLRNKLLMYRFRNFHTTSIDPALANPEIDNRLNQIYLPLLSVARDPLVQAEIASRQRQGQKDLAAGRCPSMDIQVLEITRHLIADRPLPLKEIADAFQVKYGETYPAVVSSRAIGSLLRTRFNLRTSKSHGNYALPVSEQAKLRQLFIRHGLISVDDASSDDDIRIIPLENGELGEADMMPTIH
jgi:hypothetical protein|tara:strand:- start:15658 stop:17046 length:1389 start_codon:yes stop_codon:yes gene_type:complete